MRACRPRCLDDVDDETEGEQHPGDGAGKCCDQGLVGTGREQLRHLPEKPEGGPRHVQHDGRYEQGEFRCVHEVSLPLEAADIDIGKGGCFSLENSVRTVFGQFLQTMRIRVHMILDFVPSNSCGRRRGVLGSQIHSSKG